MDALDPRGYPKLTLKQKDRLLRQVAVYFAAMDWFRSGHQARDFAYPGEQLELFSRMGKLGHDDDQSKP
jgi:hypothetical protein